jgi:hypothetical protein
MQTMKEFRGHGEQKDDATVIVLRSIEAASSNETPAA